MNTDRTYSVSAELARRSGLAEGRYRTADGRFIMSESDIRYMIARRILSIGDLADTEKLHETDSGNAGRLIAENGYQTGFTVNAARQATVEDDNEKTEEDIDNE